MSEEKKAWNVTVVFDGMDKQGADELSEFLLGKYELDFAAMHRRMSELLIFLQNYAEHVYTISQLVDFEAQSEEFSTHPKVVIRDIHARSKYILEKIHPIMRGQLKLREVDKQVEELLKAIKAQVDNEAQS